MKQRFCVAVAVLALAACGSDSTPTGADLCTKAGTVATNITSKLAACVPNAGSFIPTGSACTATLASCSAADQAILNGVLDCLNAALPSSPVPSAQCSSVTQTGGALNTALNTCTDSSHVGNLSAACASATGFGGSSGGSLGAGSCTYAASSTGGGVCVQLVGVDLSASLCSLFNQPGLTFTYSSSACGSTVGGQPKLGTCTLSVSGVTAKMAIYGTSATDGATACTSQGGQWAAGT